MRIAEINRKTAETDIKITLDLDGAGASVCDTGCGFLDHMLTLFARHGRMNLNVTCKGDVWVDDHHTVEDVGIALGQAIAKALGEKRGIRRYGDITLPMDEALILAAVDISGRGGYYGALNIPTQKVGSFDTELVEEFFLSFVRTAGLNLHIKSLSGSNTHHIIEGTFKAVARALREAVKIDSDFKDEIPSTKGVL